MVLQEWKADGSSPEAMRLMSRAIELSVENVRAGGGPFGAVVVHNGKIIGEGANRVTRDFDPTAHAEVVALRAACRHEQRFHLTECEIYTSCEPCPMCLAASYWAHVSKIYYAADAASAAAAGFGDAFLYEQFKLTREQRELPLIHVAHPDTLRAFEEWDKNPARVEY